MISRSHKFSMTPFALVFLIMGVALSCWAQAPGVRTAVEKQEVYVGERFRFQLQFQGVEAVEAPDFTDAEGFTVQYIGGQRNSNQSVSIVNGRMTREVNKGFICQYEFIAKHEGRLTIPAKTVDLDGTQVQTEAVTIVARKPTESKDFKLRTVLSKERCYVGEPVTFTCTWYLGRDVSSVAITAPILEDARFIDAGGGAPTTPAGQVLALPLNGGQTEASRGQASLDGQVYTTVSFLRTLIPKEPGVFAIPETTVTAETITGRRSASLLHDFFGDDFTPFGSSQRETVVIPSNPLKLEVLPLPEEGKPANFNGLVGEYSIDVSATPSEVNAGDPVTVSIRVTGPSYLDNVELPPLEKQPGMTDRFRIPKEMAAGKSSRGVKEWTQTLRPLDKSVTEIPPITLSYFDTKTGTYKDTKSAPVPITVHEAQIVTSADAEGGAPVLPERSPLTAWREGVAHNYEGPMILREESANPAEWLKNPWILLMALAPPALFGGLALQRLWSQRVGSASYRRRRALQDALARLTDAQDAMEVLGAVRAYLSAHLGLNATSLVYADTRQPLAKRGVDAADQEALRELFTACEAQCYAGGHGGEDAGSLVQRARDVLTALDKELCK